MTSTASAYNASRDLSTATFIENTTFGVEVETHGRGDDRAVKAIQSVIGGVTGHHSRGMQVTAPDGRVWVAMHDGSIQGSYGSEVVTPILKGAADLETLQQVVRALRAAGGKSDAAHQCGVHVHVGTQGLDAAAIGRVVKTVAKYDGFIRKAAGVSAERARWCAPLTTPTWSNGHVANIPALGRARTMDQLARAWYGTANEAGAAYSDHYQGSRYHGLNLHSVFYRNRGTVEFRYFDGTMHAGKIKSYVHLCLAIVAKAASTKAASATPAVCETAQQASNLLIGLHLKGDAFKTARHHLTAAWNPERVATSEAA